MNIYDIIIFQWFLNLQNNTSNDMFGNLQNIYVLWLIDFATMYLRITHFD